MVNYEGVFILDPDLSADVAKTTVTQIQDLVTKNGGRIDGIQEWGKKRLAYEIKKKKDGSYVVLNFQLDSLSTKKVDQTLRLNDNILRFLLVNKDNL